MPESGRRCGLLTECIGGGARGCSAAQNVDPKTAVGSCSVCLLFRVFFRASFRGNDRRAVAFDLLLGLGLWVLLLLLLLSEH